MYVAYQLEVHMRVYLNWSMHHRVCHKFPLNKVGANQVVEFVDLDGNPCSSQQIPDSDLPPESWVHHQQTARYEDYFVQDM